MPLDEYHKKRNFSNTPEPKGDKREDVRGDLKDLRLVGKDDVIEDISTDKYEKGEKDRSRIFVIHEHHAKRLHWDLRLEIGGVLKSWAVPKNPDDVNKGVRRLAIHVEDHPIEYADFEGSIPEGMYGAGTVAIYDSGEFILEEETENKLNFELKGKKMNGVYTLIYVPKMGEKSWLFFKKMITF